MFKIDDLLKKLTFQKVVVLIAVIFFAVGLYFFCIPRKLQISKYYDLLNQDDMVVEQAESKDKFAYDIHKLDKCKYTGKGQLSELCYKDFFQKYTKVNGPQKGLEYLHQLIQEDTTTIPGCHYMAHGIGAGAYEYYNYNVGKAYTFDVSKIFTNLGSCANGYYHGVSIGMTEKAKSDDELYNILYGFCDKRINNEDLGKEACNHGIGHAVTLYYNHDLNKSVAMCHRLFTGKTAEGFFGCMTGTRMEYGMFLDETGLWTEKGAQGILDLCKDYAYNTQEREACVVEGSGVVRYGEDYITAVKACQTLPTATDRKACTKLTVIHAIRLGRSEQVLDLCKIPIALNEKIECTAFFANYLSISVDINRHSQFLQVTSDVCHTLNIFLYPKCIAEATNRNLVTFRSNVERGVFMSWNDIKYFFGYYVSVWNGCVKCNQKLINEDYAIGKRM